MLNRCQVCKERCFPGNPAVGFYGPHGRWHPPLCRHCPNRPIEQAPAPAPVKAEDYMSLYDKELVQLRATTKHLENKMQSLERMVKDLTAVQKRW